MFVLQFKKIIHKSIVTSCILLLIPFIGYAEIYKYTDENGKTHYSDKPFKKNSEVIEVKKNAPQPDPNSTDRKITRDKMLKIFAEEREQKKEQQAQEAAKRKQRKEECNALQGELKDYQQNDSLLYELDENYERYYLTDKDIDERIAILQEQVDEVCLKKWLKD